MIDIWIIVNVFLRATLTALLAYKLIVYNEQFNMMERLGMGFIGGCSFMTIAIIYDAKHAGTPFDGWAGSFMTAGCVIYFLGRMARHWGLRKGGQPKG